MKKLLLFTLGLSLLFAGCSKDSNDGDSKGNVQKAIDAITDKSSAKSIIIAGELTATDWSLLKDIREQLPAVENITLNDASTIKRDVFAYKNGIAWTTNRWLKSISAPKATKIEDVAFHFCESLSDINAPSVEIIGAEAFWGCDNITSFNFPKVKEIEDEAFVACEKLESIILPELLELKDEVFHGCKSLANASFPKVTKIGNRPFRGCDNLSEIKFGAVTEINVSLLAFELLSTNNITIDLSGFEATQAIGKVWKNKTWKNITTNGQALPEPDFGIANFGATMDFVSQNETKNTVSGGNSQRLIYKDNSNNWYTYNFDENKLFTSGTWDCSIQFGGSPTDLVFLPITNFVTELNKLKNKFGDPDSASKDVFSFNMTDKTMQPSYAWYEAQAVMNGGTPITYKFSNTTTQVETVLSTYLRTGKTQTWGFSIRTTYSKKL